MGFKVDDSIPPETYSVGLHLVDAGGALQAQADYGLPAAGQSCRMAEIPINGLVPDEYQLRMFVYNWQTGERLTTVGMDGEAADSADLMDVAINDGDQ
jgi:hypothetical protein